MTDFTARIPHAIKTEEEALETARQLARTFDVHASARDAERRLPWDELAALSASGLTAITTPASQGGADVSIQTLTDVFVILADADPSLAQIPQNHFAILERLRLYGTQAQQDFFYPRILAGDRLGNATAERGDKRPNEHGTRLTQDGTGYRLNGRKVYATGALFAHWVPVSAVDEQGNGWVVFTPREAPGLTVVDDWDSFGQRTTASGTVILEQVYVEALNAFPSAASVNKPDTISSVSQLIHVAIDLGIAHRAIRDTIILLQTDANPARGSGVRKAGDDPLALREIGELKLRYHAAEAMTQRAARKTDQARRSLNAVDIGEALIAVAEAKILTSELALHASGKLFELGGTHTTATTRNLDRHWRNARAHTLHDGVRWKYHAIGNYYLNDLLADAWSVGHPYAARPIRG